MSRSGSDLLSRPSSRTEPTPRGSSRFDLERGLLVMLASAAVAGFGLLIHFFTTMGTALP